MASYEFSTEITADVEVEVEITVQDEQGNEIECDAEGYGTDITVNLDLSEVKENLKEDLKEELQEEVRQQIIDEIGDAANPMQSLAEFILLVGNVDKVNKERADDRLRDLGANIKALEIVVAERDKEISTLTQHIADLSEVSLQRPDKADDQIRLARSNDALAIIAAIKTKKE